MKTESIECVATRRVTSDGFDALSDLVRLCAVECERIRKSEEGESDEEASVILGDLRGSLSLMGLCLLKILKEGDALEGDEEER